MRIVSFIFILFLLNFSLIKCENNDEKINDTKSNVPIIKSSSSNIFFEEQFQEKTKWTHWTQSQAKKNGVEEHISKYDGQWAFEIPESSVYKDNYGLILKSKERHHAISVHLNKPFDFSLKTLIVQYEVNFPVNFQCGGAYIKLLSYDGKYPDLKQVTDKTPYTIMFGPDKCGVEQKYHFIIRFRNPKTGIYNEHQAKKSSELLDSYFTDKRTHLYTLILSDDNNFQMYIDNKLINSGNLLKDMEPSIIPEKEIIDENDTKPENWDEQEKIVDVNAIKPDDWDETAPKEIIDQNAKIPNDWLENEPLTIPDPDAAKPELWDDEMDGIWEAPIVDNPLCKKISGCGKWSPTMMPNPAYKGPWSLPLIDNPNYRGKWERRKILNPDYFEDDQPYKLTPIGSLALELWSLVDGIVFDNFLITSDQSVAKQYADQLWDPKSILEGRPITPLPKTKSLFEDFVDMFIKPTRRRPWLWALYVALLVLPILIIIGACYLLREPKRKKKISNRMKKKNDDYTDDDDDNDNYEEESEHDQREVKSKKIKKDALEKPSSTDRKSRRRTRKE